jgi:hypothetical protein
MKSVNRIVHHCRECPSRLSRRQKGDDRDRSRFTDRRERGMKPIHLLSGIRSRELHSIERFADESETANNALIAATERNIGGMI